MCSVLGIFEIEPGAAGLRRRALDLSRRQRHRGPDWSGIYSGQRAILAHERLSIVDVESGAQPLFGPDRSTVLAVNGEIYNHKPLEQSVASGYPFRTRSDCEVILALYEGQPEDPASWLNELSGIFAFALYDEARDRYLIARDPIGVMPLYTGRDDEGRFYVASEMKALIDTCPEIHDFPPGHMLDSRSGDGRPVPYYRPAWREYDAVVGGPTDPAPLREALEAAVHRQLMSDVPYGVLLSGGLDSSIISALAMKFSRRRVETGDTEEAWWPRLHSFAVGLEGAPDLAAARAAAEAIGTVHHEIVYTLREGLDAVSDVIHHLETFDVTTVRASTPMYLMARRIKAMGIKMVLSGEGADEVFGGYLYFHKAPHARAFHEETVRKLDQLHKYDCLRANKSMAAWGGRGTRPLPRPRVPRRRHGPRPRGEAAGKRPHGEAHPARGVRGTPSRRGPVAPEGTVLRWRGLLLDRQPKGDGRGRDQRRPAGEGGGALPHEYPAHEGSLRLPRDLRLALPGRAGGPLRPRGPEHRLQHAGGHCLGPGLPRHGRPVRPRRAGRPRSQLLSLAQDPPVHSRHERYHSRAWMDLVSIS